MTNSNTTNAPDPNQDLAGDTCQQCLLTIVARGTAIITELYRLVELIPEPFLEKQLYLDPDRRLALNEIVFDFSYFKDAERLEAKIEADLELKRADEQFCDHHVDMLTRFYLTFEAVQRHANDLNRFIVDLDDEVYLGQSLESLLVHDENRQLLCEAYFQLGHMLLLVDRSFEGNLRERLIVSYYRYSAYRSSPDSNIDETCNLMRSTGYRCHQQKCYGGINCAEQTKLSRPSGYPENYLSRVSVNQSVVSTLIAKLQTVDIYNQTVNIFPHPDHRSSALAQQASILYVLLYFCPNILRAQRSRMREITDKFFSDNWVVHVFMGEFVNLLESWDPYKAARESLVQIYDIDCVRNLTTQFSMRFNRNYKQLEQYLREAWLNEDSFMEHSSRILNCLRDSNVVLKWLLLHSRMRPSWQLVKLTRTLHAVVMELQPESKRLCEFLQNLCALEKRILELYDNVLSKKHSKVVECKLKACDMLDELVSIFNDSKPMRWVKAGANLSLAKILEEARTNLEALELGQGLKSSQRDSIIRLVNRIEAARESYLDGKSLQVVQLFNDTKESLVRMLRLLDLTGDLRAILQTAGDFSYGWRLMDEIFTPQLQLIVKEEPRNLFGFEAIVIKLTSAFESQLMRIQQLEAQTDLISVSQYYSSKLVAYIRSVLQIIPATILELILAIIDLQHDPNHKQQMPSKIHLDQLKDYAQPEQRFQMLQLTCKISHYAKGMMSMPNTPIGLMRIDSKQMLESGIRRELNLKMTDAIQSTLKFSPSGQSVSTRNQFGVRLSSAAIPLSGQSILDRLHELSSILNSYKKSFEYIQDFLFIYGLKMWQEELGSIVRSSVDQAISSLMDNSRNVQLLHHNRSNDLETRSLRSLSTMYTSRTSSKTATGGGQSAGVKLSAITTASQAGNETASKLEASFMVRLLDELLRLTNPHETIYEDQSSIWFDRKLVQPNQRRQVLDATRALKLIGDSLGVAGLNGLDKLCSCLLMIELEKLASLLADNRQPQQDLTSMFEALNQVQNHQLDLGLHAKGTKHLLLALFFASLSAASPSLAVERLLIDHLLSAGQLQIIRLNIQCVLSNNCRFEARHLHGCLEALNAALLETLRQGRRRPPTQQKADDSSPRRLDDGGEETADRPSNISMKRGDNSGFLVGESQLVFELANYLEWVGSSEPMSKIYTLELQRAGGDQLAAPGVSESNEKQLVYQILEQATKFYGGGGNSTSNRQHSAARSCVPPTAEQALQSVDGLPLYLGIQTLLNHFQANLVV